MKILSIDTTREFGSLALCDSGEIVEEVLLHSPEGFSTVLFERTGRLLRAHDWEPGDVDCFAAASGPGSFTGVRVGLAAAKGLAQALGKPVVAVSNLQALASCGSGPLRAPLLDARRGEVYAALYDAGLSPVLPEVVTKLPAWLERLAPGEVEFVSTDFGPLRAAFQGTRFEGCRLTEAPRALAAPVARIAYRRLRAGQAQDPAEADANYVRRSDAELFWKEA
ncbi:MAG: tRNA (adenosine(37)-N6)-threonylcarbamoyltransferase complex dimerization subunit type 1 TsaB [Bryobacterales bacterium]|nr:tRNA (adenosine(37)-N6)-threonylcarbamoyltransferase complex dimerization subunit type 1 TsaB [Bryobacterales bacterium]